MARILGIDFGSKRVGVAVSDEDGTLAFPLYVISNDEKLLSKIKELCDKDSISKLVMGESKDFKGEPNKIMKEVEIFVEKLKEELKLEVVLEPEFMSSEQAVRFQGKSEHTDASAAAIILQSYLDRK